MKPACETQRPVKISVKVAVAGPLVVRAHQSQAKESALQDKRQAVALHSFWPQTREKTGPRAKSDFSRQVLLVLFSVKNPMSDCYCTVRIRRYTNTTSVTQADCLRAPLVQKLRAKKNRNIANIPLARVSFATAAQRQAHKTASWNIPTQLLCLVAQEPEMPENTRKTRHKTQKATR